MFKLKSVVPVFSYFLLAIFISSPVFAAPSVSIEGQIKDVTTGEALPGANIMVLGTSLGAGSDLDGNYFIPKVPQGSYTLRATFIGYKNLDVTIQIDDQKTIIQDFALEYEGLTGETIMVTAQAEGQLEAINQQLSATQIMNVVSSDRIQELPDANAAESVGRLPGVSILRSGGEGTKVVIRGLSPKYNTVMIEGVRMASTDFDDRSSDLSMISPYMLEGIEVLKAITPDQDGDALGGSVNFRIKEAREELGIDGSRFGYDVIARGGYNGLTGTYNDYKFVGDVSTRLLDNRLGILAQVDIEKRNRSSHEMGASYKLSGQELGVKNPVFIYGLNLNNIPRDRKRFGGTFVLDYKLPAGKLAFKNFFSLGDTKITNRAESYNIDDLTHNYSVTDARSKLNVMTNVLNYEQRFSTLKIDAKVSRTSSINDSPENISFSFRELNAFSDADNKVHPTELPSFAENNLDATQLSTISEYDKKSIDKEYAAAINTEIDFRILKQLSGKIKFGGKYRYKDRTYDHNSISGLFNLGSAQETREAIINAFPWMKETVQSGSSNLPYTLFIDKDYDAGTFINGDYTLGPSADVDLLYDVLDVIREVDELAAYQRNDYASNTNDYAGNEYISAGYIMTDLKIGQRLKIIPGIRYEHAKTSYEGARGNSSSTFYKVRYPHHDTTTVQKNDHWLPMVHVRYHPVSWFDVRFAYTNTLSRPDFRRIIPRYNLGLTAVSWNNYKLKPSESKNFDLYFSIHENHVGLFTFGLFEKRIDNMIYSTTRNITDPSEYELGQETENQEIYTSMNNPNQAKVRGLELDWQTHFWYLPGLLKGLVMNVNYTHISSEAKYPRTVVEDTIIFFPVFQYIKNYVYSYYDSRLLHQPDDIVNVAIGYDYQDFSVRLSMLYQSNIFMGTNFWSELRRITDDYVRWDLSIKQDLPWSGLQLYCNVNNLSNALDRNLNRGSQFPSSEQHYGRTVDIGLRLRL